MIKDIKLGLSAMKYGLNYYGVIALILTTAGAGFLFAVFMPMSIIPSMLLGVGIMGEVNEVYSLSVSTMVQSSPHKKRLRTTIPAFFAMIIMLLANTLNILFYGVSYFVGKDGGIWYHWQGVEYGRGIQDGDYQISILLSSFIWVCMLLFGALVRRFLWAGVLILLLSGRMGMFTFFLLEEASCAISVEMAIILSYIIVLLGCGILYVMNYLLYRYPLSERKFRTWMKYESQ